MSSSSSSSVSSNGVSFSLVQQPMSGQMRRMIPLTKNVQKSVTKDYIPEDFVDCVSDTEKRATKRRKTNNNRSTKAPSPEQQDPEQGNTEDGVTTMGGVEKFGAKCRVDAEYSSTSQPLVIQFHLDPDWPIERLVNSSWMAYAQLFRHEDDGTVVDASPAMWNRRTASLHQISPNGKTLKACPQSSHQFFLPFGQVWINKAGTYFMFVTVFEMQNTGLEEPAMVPIYRVTSSDFQIHKSFGYGANPPTPFTLSLMKFGMNGKLKKPAPERKGKGKAKGKAKAQAQAEAPPVMATEAGPPVDAFPGLDTGMEEPYNLDTPMGVFPDLNDGYQEPVNGFQEPNNFEMPDWWAQDALPVMNNGEHLQPMLPVWDPPDYQMDFTPDEGGGLSDLDLYNYINDFNTTN